jgi:hypothetical protein
MLDPQQQAVEVAIALLNESPATRSLQFLAEGSELPTILSQRSSTIARS